MNAPQFYRDNHEGKLTPPRVLRLMESYAEHKTNEYKNHPLNKMIYDKGREVISEELKQIPEGIYGDVTVEEYFDFLNQKI